MKEKERNVEEILKDEAEIVQAELEIVKEIEDKAKKTEEYLEQLQRTLAEFENYKKRTNKDKENMYNTLVGDIVSEFLPVLDNLDNALKQDDSNTKQGIELISKQFSDILKSLNVEEIETKDGFNPEFHEAVMHIEDSNYGEKSIAEVFRKGYIINDKVIRHALVKVAN